MALVGQKRSSGGGAFRKLLAVVGVVGIAAGAFMLWRQLKLPPPAAVELTSDLPAVGRKTTFTLKASEPVKGIESVTVTVDGAGVAKAAVPVALADGTATFAVGKEAFPALK